MKIFMDESGYTGEDLLNNNQPIFVLCSTILGDDIGLEIFNEFFKGVQGNELKHSNLGSRLNGQKRIVDFIKKVKDQKVFTTFVVHKEFNLVTYLIDLWVESAMYQDGYDLYDKGGNIALANLTYTILYSLLPDNSFQKYLARFQKMMRNRTHKNYERFWSPLYEIYHSRPIDSNDPLSFVMSLLLGAEMKLGFPHLLSLPPHPLDIAVSSALLTISHWREKTDEPFTVIHDKSATMSKNKWLWEIIVNPKIPPREVGHDRRKMIFPLKVDKTILANSKDYLQLQFADIIAGASLQYCKSKLEKNGSEYAKKLGDAGIEEFLIGGVWPSKEVSPEDLGTIGENMGSAEDFIAMLIRNSENRNSGDTD
jgi:hypothetical protein